MLILTIITGGFTFFITLSSAETKWPELLRALKMTVDGIPDADVSNMDFREKSRLIQKDPVTCARYFNKRFQELLKSWTKTNEGPFGTYKLKDYFYRIEFQHRGSPHVHMLVWLEDAPQFDSDNPASHESVTNFIDKIVSCSSDIDGLEDLITVQRHKCTQTCSKNKRNKNVCRFDAPFKPIDKTTILMPFIKEEKEKLTENDKTLIRNRNRHIKELLDKLPPEIETFEEFLEKLNCSKENYITALRATLKKPKILLKRSPKDNRINAFSPKILKLMRSNMDIQFALDIFACVGYVVDYINKSNGGISKVMSDMVREVQLGNHTIRQQLKILGNAFYNGTEICAQEAAWVCMGLRMCCGSVKVQYINTNKIEKRSKMIKPASQLKNLDENSTDIYVTGALERYSIRPEIGELKDICLADFIANYEYKALSKTKKAKKGSKNSGDAEEDEISFDEGETDEDINYKEEEEEDDNDRDDSFQKQQNDDLLLKDPANSHIVLGKFNKRRRPKILRFHLANVELDPENYFRQVVMLFYPYRNEQEEVENQDCQEIYTLPSNRLLIETNMRKYRAIDIDMDAILKELEDFKTSEDSENEDSADDDDEYVNPFGADGGERVPNIMVDIGMEPSSDFSVKKYTVPKMVNDEEYNKLISSQNEKQLAYLMHVLHSFRTHSKPFYHFISGGAGVGKTHLIKAIFQSLTREFRKAGGPPEIEILLLAPTGKAAHNIDGMTAHHALSLTVTQNANQDIMLSPDTANTLAAKYFHLKLIIIDEISMVGAKTFNCINRRLQQIFRTKEMFGSIPMICLGDFNQLPVSFMSCL